MSFSLPEFWVYPSELLINVGLEFFFLEKFQATLPLYSELRLTKASACISLASSVGCTGFCFTLRVLCGWIQALRGGPIVAFCLIPVWACVQWSLWIHAFFLFLFVSRNCLDLSPWLYSSILRTTILGNRRRKWQPTPVFLTGESQGQRSLAGYSPWGRKSQTRLSN